MKTLAVLTLGMMMAPAAGASGHTYFPDSATFACVNATNAAGSYRSALASKNIGVVESALAHVAMIALTVPACDVTKIEEAVAAIERRGSTEEIRYKAWLVRQLMDNREMFAGGTRGDYDGPDALFAALTGRMALHYAIK